MSIVTYHGITLPYPLHSSFEMETVYDESGTDRVYTKIACTVQCIINKAYFSQISSAIDPAFGADIAQAMRWIRYQLLQPRKDFSVKVGNEELLPSKQSKNAGANRTVDAKNGPLPQSCIINKLSDNTFLMTYSIIAHYGEAYSNVEGAINGTGKDGNPIINCRWSETQEIDQEGYSRRIREGTMVLRSDNVEGQTIDIFRESFAVVGIPFGFVRKSSKYTVDRSGLGLSFYLEDQEVYVMPPFPAYTASGWYTESTTRMNANRFGECQVELRGSKTSDKTLLLYVAFLVVLRKLQGVIEGRVPQIIETTATFPTAFRRGLNQLTGKPNIGRITQRAVPKPVIMESMTVRSALYENSVSVNARFSLGPGQSVGTIELGDPIPICSVPAGSEADASPPVMSTYGNPDVDLVLKAAAYFDLALQQKLNQELGQLLPGSIPGQPGEG